MKPGTELYVLVLVLITLQVGSYFRIPETDLMKQAFAAIAGVITGVAGTLATQHITKPKE